MAEHYRPQSGSSWLVARSMKNGPFVLYSGANPRIVAGAVGSLQCPATLVRIQISAIIMPGASYGDLITSVGPCWSSARLVSVAPPGVADPAGVHTVILDWDFRLTDHVLVLDPGAVCADLDVHVSGEALVTSAGLLRGADLSFANPLLLVGG